MSGSYQKKAGLPPGTLVHFGDKKESKVGISAFQFDKDSYKEHTSLTSESVLELLDTDRLTWININGLHDPALIGNIGSKLGLHPLILEDILDTDQRPKIDDREEHIFIVLRMMDLKSDKLKSEQVSIVLKEDLVITFQERKGDVFEPVRERIRKSTGKVRTKKADYLAYALMDAIVDNYYVILEKMGENYEGYEDKLINDPDPKDLKSIHRMKREISSLRKSIWPTREVVSSLERTDSKLIQKGTKAYLRDLYDHTIQVMDNIESNRDSLSGLTDLYLSSVSNKMNEVMKVLTIIATIFIPLTFIAGIYGMNFNPDSSPLNMPELNFYLGYPIAIGAMVVVAIIMIIYFKKKKWL